MPGLVWYVLQTEPDFHVAEEEEELIVFQIANLTALKFPYLEKPSGYSLFAHEIVPVPRSWAAMTCNLVSYNQHERGGHFAVRDN